MNPINLTALMYHYVRDPNDAAESGSGIPGMPLYLFEDQIDYLAAHYEIVSWLDVKKHISGDRALSPEACLLTFDDGVCDHYINVFPALHKRSLSGLFFALARTPASGLALGHKIHFLLARLGFMRFRDAFCEQLDTAQQLVFQMAEAKYEVDLPIETEQGNIDAFKLALQRDLSDSAETILSKMISNTIGPEVEIADHFYLTSSQMLEMAAEGMHFGGHSQTHPWLDWVNSDRRAQEIEASAAWLSTFEASPWCFAYPYGGVHSQSPALLRASGFIAAFTTVQQVTHADPFLIGRFDAGSFTQDISGADVSTGSS